MHIISRPSHSPPLRTPSISANVFANSGRRPVHHERIERLTPVHVVFAPFKPEINGNEYSRGSRGRRQGRTGPRAHFQLKSRRGNPSRRLKFLATFSSFSKRPILLIVADYKPRRVSNSDHYPRCSRSTCVAARRITRCVGISNHRTFVLESMTPPSSSQCRACMQSQDP
jgi:hypothetical protein